MYDPLHRYLKTLNKRTVMRACPSLALCLVIQRVSKAKEVARRYAKDEDVLNKALLSKYGSNLLSENESRLEERIREFYAKHALERVSRAKEVARRYVNDEDVLNEQLMSKYGSDLREVRLQNRDSVQEDR